MLSSESDHWKIKYACQDVQNKILELPPGLAAKYLHLTNLMMKFGANLGMPHTRAMSDGLFELRVKGREGIARVFYCTMVGKEIIMLHCFIKKSRKTPVKEINIARKRLANVKETTDNEPRRTEKKAAK